MQCLHYRVFTGKPFQSRPMELQAASNALGGKAFTYIVLPKVRGCATVTIFVSADLKEFRIYADAKTGNEIRETTLLNHGSSKELSKDQTLNRSQKWTLQQL